MLGKIIDINKTDAYVIFEDGLTKEIGTAHIPPNSKVGDMVHVNPDCTRMCNEKLIDFF